MITDYVRITGTTGRYRHKVTGIEISRRQYDVLRKRDVVEATRPYASTVAVTAGQDVSSGVMMGKPCPRCKQSWPIDETEKQFGFRMVGKVQRRQSYCRECRRAHGKK